MRLISFQHNNLLIIIAAIAGAGMIGLAAWSIFYADITNKPSPIVTMIQAILIRGPHAPVPTLPLSQSVVASSVHDITAKKGSIPSISPTKTVLVTQTPIQNLASSQNQGLRNLGSLQNTYHTYIANQLMLFVSQGGLQDDMVQAANDFSQTLQEFTSKGVTPLVIVEPTDEEGNNLPLDQLNTYAYIHSFTIYLNQLQSDGITNAQMGTWVFLPEENLPEWDRGTTTPADYANIINTYISLLKQIFPEAKGSIMLDSQSFSGTYANSVGTFSSLSTYVSGIRKGLVDTFGFQGFPWVPAANTTDTAILDPAQFLNPAIAIEAANILGTKNIWINSGTFSDMYINDTAAAVHIPDSERSLLLTGILSEISSIKQRGYSVSMNLFAADKSNTPEATNWSYTKNPALLTPFLVSLQQMEIPLSLFTEQ